MKTLSLVIVGIVSAALLQAQEAAGVANPPDLEIVKKSWRREVINSRLDQDPFKANDQYRENVLAQQQANEYNAKKPEGQTAKQPRVPPSGKPVVEKAKDDGAVYYYQAKVKNTGARTIRSIAWEYVFLDSETKEEITRFQCDNKVKIGPGKSEDLLMTASNPPSNVIDASKVDKGKAQFIELIVISRIEYGDGSFWQRPQN